LRSCATLRGNDAMMGKWINYVAKKSLCPDGSAII